MKDIESCSLILTSGRNIFIPFLKFTFPVNLFLYLIDFRCDVDI